MPLYVYLCKHCGVKAEYLVSGSDAANNVPPPRCETCRKTNGLVKQPTCASVQLKGGGWAKDGYQRDT